MQIKLIFTRKVVHLASFWKWGFSELGSGLFVALTTASLMTMKRTPHLPFRWMALALDTHTGWSVDTDVKASNDFYEAIIKQSLLCNETNSTSNNDAVSLIATRLLKGLKILKRINNSWGKTNRAWLTILRMIALNFFKNHFSFEKLC